MTAPARRTHNRKPRLLASTGLHPLYRGFRATPVPPAVSVPELRDRLDVALLRLQIAMLQCKSDKVASRQIDLTPLLIAAAGVAL